MADNKEAKVVLEREYIVPLRASWLKVPEYKRANKAVKTLREFMVRHMKLYTTDLRKVRVDELVNNEIRHRGMKKPPARLKVKAVKYDDGIVRVFLVDLPEHVKYKLDREKNKTEKKDEKKEEVVDKKEEKTEEKKEEKSEKEIKNEEEKESAVKEEGVKRAKQEHKAEKHTSKDKKVKVHRKALSR